MINIIDFRDPDCTMTHWQNPDVTAACRDRPAHALGPVLMPSDGPTAGPGRRRTRPTPSPWTSTAWSTTRSPSTRCSRSLTRTTRASARQANRFFVELVNTLTQSAFAALPPSPGGANPPDPSILDLGGFQYTPGDPYSGGCWDLVFTDDTPNSRPDPYRGELVQGGQFYALIPLNKDSFTASAAGAAAGSSSSPGSDLTLVPLGPAGVPVAIGGQPGGDPSHTADELLLRLRQQSTQPGVRDGTPSPTTYYPAGNGIAANTPSLVQYLSPAADPFNGPATPKITWYPGVLPGVVADSGTSRAPRRPTISRSSPP